ncbi:hypothetical protein [Micromonospora sp. NPDC051141]|uniref:hypothetical protein n=1 Tax=Micromonospora sp. NPDC051141 TaxID=3364284 RepID=UPI0037B9BFDF
MSVAADAEDRRVALIRQLIAGAGAVVLATFAAVVMFPAEEPVGRVLVMAVVCGLLAAWFSDWRATIVTTAVAVGVFVGILADGAPPTPTAWGFTPIFLVAVVLGMGNRLLRLLSRREEGHRRP